MPKENFISQSSVLNLPVPPTRKASEYLDAYEGWVYTAVNAIAQEVASLNFRLYRKKYVKEKLEVEEVTEHEALSLLYEVNSYSNYYEHLYATSTYLDLLGEAYWGIVRGPNKRIESLWILRPDWVTIHSSESKLIDHYTYRAGGNFSGKEVSLAAEDVIPFKLINPKHPYRGKGSVQAAALEIDIESYAGKWNRNFFFNSALPSVVFTTEKNLNKEQIDMFMAQWSAKFQGVENSHKIAFLGGGLTATPLGLTAKDMDFIEQQRIIRDKILGIFKVPKSIIGITEDVNRANAEATVMAFMERVVTPRAKMLVSHLNEFYLDNWPDEDLFFDFDDPSPQDVELNLKIYENGLAHGWLTRNEVRENENMEPVEGGDVIYLPFSYTPLGTDNSQMQEAFNPGKSLQKLFGKKSEEKEVLITMSAKKKNSKPKRKFNIPIPPKKLRRLREQQIVKGIKTDLIKLVSLVMKMEGENGVSTEDMVEKKKTFRENYWKQMVAKTDVFEARMKERLNKFFNQQEEMVLEKVEHSKGIMSFGRKALVNTLLFDNAEEADKLRAEMAPFLKAILEQEGLEGLDFVGTGGSLDLTTDEVIRFLNKEGLKFVKGVNETTRDDLKKTLSEGLSGKEGIPELKKRVSDVYDAAKGYRAEGIARTEVLRATNFATQESYRQSEVVEGMEWLTALDERVDEECADLDGAIVKLNETFKSALGPVDYPPLHVNCRCTTIPVLAKDAMDNSFENPQRVYNSVNWDGIEGVSQKERNESVAQRFDNQFNSLEGFTEEFTWKPRLIDIKEINIWAPVDEDKVAKYLKDLKKGDKFPPLLLVNRGGVLDALDGAHRVEAYKRAGAKKVHVLVGELK